MMHMKAENMMYCMSKLYKVLIGLRMAIKNIIIFANTIGRCFLYKKGLRARHVKVPIPASPGNQSLR